MKTIAVEINFDIDIFNWIQKYKQELSIDEFVNMIVRAAMPEHLADTIDD
ncbi:MAG: hypothetical protein K2Y14_02050 [Burkholderiales bacterium]|jgi:hypothetical protein|nr:hypothetical protein [Burkholderiales bacterium]